MFHEKNVAVIAFVLGLCTLSLFSDLSEISSTMNTSKVNKSGDTMTGALTINSNSGNVLLALNRPGYSVISSNNSLYIRPGAGLFYLVTAGANNRFFVYNYASFPDGCTYTESGGHQFLFYKNCTGVMRFSATEDSFINTGYNMSIGKTRATATLDVSGTFRVNSSARFDTLNQTGTHAICTYESTPGVLVSSTNGTSSYLTC